jgi:hypothetical protein
MKTAILAVLLLLLAVTTIVSGAPTESGKSLHGHETRLVVILQTLEHYKIVSFLNYEIFL